jgi:hypothetical protein
MDITRKSLATGVTRTRDLNITPQQIDAYLNGALIQNAFPQLDADDREFFKTGITSEEWEQLYKEDVEDKDLAEQERLIDESAARFESLTHP